MDAVKTHLILLFFQVNHKVLQDCPANHKCDHVRNRDTSAVLSLLLLKDSQVLSPQSILPLHYILDITPSPHPLSPSNKHPFIPLLRPKEFIGITMYKK